MATKIKKGDEVLVTTGRDTGKKGTVLRVDPARNKVLVQGVNIVKRHTKPSQTNAGGIINKEAPIDASNLAHIDPEDGKATRVGFKILDDGRKVRYAKRSGEVIDS